jgi:uncharacterized membrane protein YecN with MAPEG domain
MEEFEIFGGNVDQYATITIACCVLHNYGLLQSKSLPRLANAKLSWIHLLVYIVGNSV